MANNADWLNTLNYIDFLRDVGRHFSVNRMLSFDSVKLRLDRQQELSFLEFNYMILQAYDFVELHKRYGCVLQMGGSDQWGNIVNGIDLGRRMMNAQLFALTSPLITTSSGAKMGKTAAGAVWLNADLVSPYDYWQYWRNTEDGDVARFLKLFTVLPLDEIARLAALQGPGDQRGEEGARDRGDQRWCTAATRPSGRRNRAQDIRGRHARGDAADDRVSSAKRSKRARRAVRRCRTRASSSSTGEARRQIKAGGLKVNDATVTDEKMVLTAKRSDARRRDQAVARQEEARVDEAGLTFPTRGALAERPRIMSGAFSWDHLGGKLVPPGADDVCRTSEAVVQPHPNHVVLDPLIFGHRAIACDSGRGRDGTGVEIEILSLADQLRDRPISTPAPTANPALVSVLLPEAVAAPAVTLTSVLWAP